MTAQSLLLPTGKTNEVKINWQALADARCCTRQEPPAWPEGFTYCDQCGTRSDMPCPRSAAEWR